MSPPDFNPHSANAMFAKVLERLDQQDKTLFEIREQVLKTNGRVNALEREKWYQRGAMAAIGVMAAGVWQLIKSKS